MKETIQSLQAGRGLAALAVVLHHGAQAQRDFVAPFPGQSVLLNGYLGVDFFFVLSGFIIFHSTVGRGRSVKDYALARFRRVYLPYWPIGIAVAVLYTFHPSGHPWSWLPTLTLLPVRADTALTVAWTLIQPRRNPEVFKDALSPLPKPTGESLGRLNFGPAADHSQASRDE